MCRVIRGMLAASATEAAPRASVERTTRSRVVASLLHRLPISWKRFGHSFYHHLGALHAAPNPRVSRETVEIFLRSNGNQWVTSFLDERRVVRGNHENWLVSTRSHSIRKPRERVHVSLTSEGNKENSERHGSTGGAGKRGSISLESQ